MDVLAALIGELSRPDLPPARRQPLLDLAEKSLEAAAHNDGWTDLPKDFRINAFIVLAANCLELAAEAEIPAKDGLFQKMRNFLGRTDRIEINERRSFVLKGFYCLFMQDLKQAADYFENARDQAEPSLAYLVGRGLLEFHRLNFAEALFFWKPAFRAFRGVLPELAHLLGVAYFRLGKLELAEKAFAYVLERLNGAPMAGHSVCGLLAVLFKARRFDEFYELLSRAFVAQCRALSAPDSPVAAEASRLGATSSASELAFASGSAADPNLSLLLAEHYFFRGDAPRALKMCAMAAGLLQFWPSDKAPKAEARSSQAELRARLAYLQGFLEHQKDSPEGLDRAYRLYSSAVQSCPRHLPAQFGLAQVFLFQKNHAEALNCLETVVQNAAETDVQEALRLMPVLYGRSNRRDKAAACFEKALQFAPKNLSLLLDYANFLDGSDSRAALRVYERVLAAWREECDRSRWQAEVFNNFGVALAKEGSLARAEQAFAEAVVLAKEGAARAHSDPASEETVRLKAALFAIRFNTASLKARRGKLSEARDVLEALCLDFRGCYEAPLGLAHVLHRLGDSEGAKRALERSIACCSHLARLSRAEEALCLKANLLIDERDYHKALAFLQRFRGADPYYLLTKARLLYAFVVAHRDSPQEVRKLVREGAEAYSLVAGRKEEEGNLFAALAAGALLLERGRLSDAREVFQAFHSVLRENSPLLHNQSILDYVTGDLEKVVLRHEGLREKSPLFLKAVYGLAFTLREDWARAERVWKYRLLHRPVLAGHFNFAAFLYQRLKSIVKPKPRGLDELERSLDGGRVARRIFLRVYAAIPDKVALCLNPELNRGEVERRRLAQLRGKTEHHLFFLEQNFEGYRAQVERERAQAQEQLASMESRKSLIVKQREDASLLEEEKLKRAKKTREEMEKRAREAEEKARDFAERFALAQKTEPAPKVKAKAGRKKTSAPEEALPKPARKPPKQSAPRKRAPRAESEEEEDDELSESSDFIAKSDESLEFEHRSIESKEGVESLGSDDADERPPAGKRQAAPHNKLKRIKREEVASEDERPAASREESSREQRPPQPPENGKKKRVFLDEEDE